VGNKVGVFEDLTGSFSKLPGIGKKSAIRIVNWLLKQDKMYVQRFAQNLSVLQDKIKPCSICGA
jgi:recombination protein RecR